MHKLWKYYEGKSPDKRVIESFFPAWREMTIHKDRREIEVRVLGWQRNANHTYQHIISPKLPMGV